VGGEGNAAGYVIAPRYWAWLGSRRAISVLLWLAALAAGAHMLWHAFTWFDARPHAPDFERRADGNGGHAQIDFGGQWVMARMLVLGHGRELYHRQRQWEVVRAGFPVADESPVARDESILPRDQRRAGAPDDLNHDANHLMRWMMGEDPRAWGVVAGGAVAPLAPDAFGNPLAAASMELAAADVVSPAVVAEVSRPAIGGPLYPPVQALFYAPLGLIERPQTAYRVAQVFGALMVLVAALGVKVLSRGRIPWSVATLVLFLFPGTRSGLDLGQNPTLSLAIVVWGWALMARGYHAAGGAVWGLFAFKPVWALAFFIVPVLMRRWRFCAAMVLTGAALGAATLPFVGLQTWFDWLEVGKKAARVYNLDHNWIHLSRDLHGVPRRILHDFSLPKDQRDTALANGLAWGLWGLVFGTTALIYLRFGDRARTTGVGAAFLFFGAFLTCYRFMYYDALLAAVGCAVLFAEPGRFLRARVFGLAVQEPALPATRELPAPAPASRSPLGPRLLGYVCSFPLTILALFLLSENSLNGLDIRATLGVGYFGSVTTAENGTTGHVIPKVQFDTGVDYPWETALALAMWAWCGWRLLRGDERPAPASIDAR
jgi:arabinofuranan 3-O-arabinosyltransferase